MSYIISGGLNATLSNAGQPAGVATLDKNGNVPILQLGNIGTTIPVVVNTAAISVINAKVGAASGIATLDSTSNVPAAQLGNVGSTTAVSSNSSGVANLNAKLGAASGIATLTSGGFLEPAQIPANIGYNVVPVVTVTGTVSSSIFAFYSIPAIDANFLIKVFVQSQGSTSGDFMATEMIIQFNQDGGTATALETATVASIASSTYGTDVGGGFSVAITAGSPNVLEFMATQSVSGSVANWSVYYQVYSCPIPTS